MNTSKTKRIALIGASMLTSVLAAGCGEPTDSPEIKQCKDARGIAIRSVWDSSMLSGCVFPPGGKAANNSKITGPLKAGPCGARG